MLNTRVQGERTSTAVDRCKRRVSGSRMCMRTRPESRRPSDLTARLAQTADLGDTRRPTMEEGRLVDARADVGMWGMSVAGLSSSQGASTTRPPPHAKRG